MIYSLRRSPLIDELRWRPPQPVIPWKGVRRAGEFAPAPIQDPAAMVELDPLVKLGLLKPKLSEGCLYLNVWTGAKKTDEKRPVMFWIHGGGFTRGMASDLGYDGTNFARKGVVLARSAKQPYWREGRLSQGMVPRKHHS